MNCLSRFFLISTLLLALPLVGQVSKHKGTIRGTVLDHTGKPVAAAIVKATYSGSFDGIVPKAKTDTSGRFVIEHLPSGAYFVTASKEEDDYPDESNAFYTGLNGCPETVVLDANHRQQSVTVHLGRKAGAIVGKVADAESGEPVEPCVEFRRKDNPSIAWSGAGLLKSTFHLLVPADTDFTMVVWQRGYEPWFYRDDSGGASLRVDSGKQLKLEIQMKPTAEKTRPHSDEELKATAESASRSGCAIPPPKH